MVLEKEYYKKYEPIFGEWVIKDLIGEGSFGKVYRIERVDFGHVYNAALKIISIPASQAEIKNALAEGMDEHSLAAYFFSYVEQVMNEFELMELLKGNSHIVNYENHKVIPHDNGIGWDILIQMELLTPINYYFKNHNSSQRDVIKLGIDMCKALEVCHKFNIIHRDIKPENIFISNIGDFKLGDFGIARTIEKTSNGLSKKGTYGYMAPEIYRGEEYGSSVDIYSLGLVLYRLLNNNRLPFLPPYPNQIKYSDKEDAFIKRMRGEFFPKPVNAGQRLAEIVLRACAFRSQDRYSSVEEMRKELESILYSEQEAKLFYPQGDQIHISTNEYAMDLNPKGKMVVVQKEKKERIEPARYGNEEPIWQNEDIGSRKKEKRKKASGVNVFFKNLLLFLIIIIISIYAVTVAYQTNLTNKNMKAENIFEQGKAYFDTDSRQEEYDYALSLLKEATELGSVDAMVYIGTIYEEGRGVEKDYKMALEWYMKASDRGNEFAKYKIGFMYEKGRGIELNHKKSIEWYEKAANLGNTDAILAMGNCYFNGIGVAQNYDKAIEWYKRGKDFVPGDICRKISDLYKDGTEIEQNLEEAEYWHRLAEK